MFEKNNQESAPKTTRSRDLLGLAIDRETIDRLRQALPTVAEATVTAVVDEVPQYNLAGPGLMGANLTQAVQEALAGFLKLASHHAADARTPLAPTLEAAYLLGRGEARSGRNIDALLAAYRVGARVAWREWSTIAVAAEMNPQTLAVFAEMVFAYIDELSASSVAGHSDELANTGRVRDRRLEELGLSLLSGEPIDHLITLAERADWAPPRTLTAVLLPTALTRTALAAIDQRTLRIEGALPDLAVSGLVDSTLLLVPDVEDDRRPSLIRVLRDQPAYVGPARPWEHVRASYQRVLRARDLEVAKPGGITPAGVKVGGVKVVDTEQHLATLILNADPEALTDLRSQVLQPLRELRPDAEERLTETLRLWLLYRGHRDEIAAALHVHPQTVRYRVGQLRDLYGDRLADPDFLLALTIALA